MSYEVENWVRHHTPVKALGPRFLLMTMANMADAEGYLWGTNEHFASVLSVTVRAIQKYSSLLEQAGAIEKLPQKATNGRTMNNAYRILTPGRTITQVRSKEPRVNGRAPSPPEQACTLPLNTRSPSPCTPVHPHRETVPQKPSTETTTAPPTPRASAPPRKPKTPAPFEEVEALRQNIAEISERTGLGLDKVSLRVTSGRTNGRERCLPRAWLSLDEMDRKAVRRSLEDSRTELARLNEGAAT